MILWRPPNFLGDDAPYGPLAMQRRLFGMASEDPSPMPLLDDWIAEVGEDEVEEIIRAGLAEVENGTARDLIDMAAYAAWVAGQRQHSAS